MNNLIDPSSPTSFITIFPHLKIEQVQEKKVIDFGFPPEGLPSLRLPLVKLMYLVLILVKMDLRC